MKADASQQSSSRSPVKRGARELITRTEYARRRGVVKSAVSRAIAAGRITLVEGMIDPVIADMQWHANSKARADGGRATTGPEGVEPGYCRARALDDLAGLDRVVLTHKQFARLVGIGPTHVGRLLDLGVLVARQPASSWVHAYCLHLRAALQAARSKASAQSDERDDGSAIESHTGAQLRLDLSRRPR